MCVVKLCFLSKCQLHTNERVLQWLALELCQQVRDPSSSEGAVIVQSLEDLGRAEIAATSGPAPAGAPATPKQHGS